MYECHFATASGNRLGNLFICTLSPRCCVFLVAVLFVCVCALSHSLTLSHFPVFRFVCSFLLFFVISILVLLLLLHLPSIEWQTSQNTLKSIDDNFYLYYCCCRCYFQMIGIVPLLQLFSKKYKCIARYLCVCLCESVSCVCSLWVYVLCLIEFGLDLNTEKTTRWNMNGERDKGWSVSSADRFIHIFIIYFPSAIGPVR